MRGNTAKRDRLIDPFVDPAAVSYFSLRFFVSSLSAACLLLCLYALSWSSWMAAFVSSIQSMNVIEESENQRMKAEHRQRLRGSLSSGSQHKICVPVRFGRLPFSFLFICFLWLLVTAISASFCLFSASYFVHTLGDGGRRQTCSSLLSTVPFFILIFMIYFSLSLATPVFSLSCCLFPCSYYVHILGDTAKAGAKLVLREGSDQRFKFAFQPDGTIKHLGTSVVLWLLLTDGGFFGFVC